MARLLFNIALVLELADSVQLQRLVQPITGDLVIDLTLGDL